MPARQPPRKLTRLVAQVRTLKRTIKSAELELKGDKKDPDNPGAEAQLVAEMGAVGVDTITITLDDNDQEVKTTATLVAAEQEVLIEADLEGLVSKKVWEEITVRKVDKQLLEDAVARGVITPQQLSDASVTQKKKPYVLINDKPTDAKPSAARRATGGTVNRSGKAVARKRATQ